MIVTPFGDLQYGDQNALSSWLAAHDQRHYAERQTIARAGVPLYAHNFAGPVDKDWFGRHMIEHSVLKDFALPDSTVLSVAMEMEWTTEDKFYRWHQIHNLLHERLDRSLGIYA